MSGASASPVGLLLSADRPITVADALTAAHCRFDPIDARVLLRHVLGVDDAWLIAHHGYLLTTAEQRQFERLIGQRSTGVPVAYLTGRCEFFGREFEVSPAVLVPRPETELLVEFALEKIPENRPCRVLDLGTGSGCIAVSIAAERPLARVTATDVSADALAVARANARAQECVNVEFVRGDWLGPLGNGGFFDVIVANPPYVPAADPHLEQLRFEPQLALVSGDDGLEAICTIAAAAPRYLARGGWLVFEQGHDQAQRCRAILGKYGLRDVFSRCDLAGIERISGGCLRTGTGTP
ncbi:MAG TPA: peptide chain release factor N(5)-glutamine methyltransferase [Burkholderiales bacterium]|nr:peptide chain release factor N(5)-glutamine methyltransferase [Burkholderiales bacterium]